MCCAYRLLLKPNKPKKKRKIVVQTNPNSCRMNIVSKSLCVWFVLFLVLGLGIASKSLFLLVCLFFVRFSGFKIGHRVQIIVFCSGFFWGVVPRSCRLQADSSHIIVYVNCAPSKHPVCIVQSRLTATLLLKHTPGLSFAILAWNRYECCRRNQLNISLLLL